MIEVVGQVNKQIAALHRAGVIRSSGELRVLLGNKEIREVYDYQLHYSWTRDPFGPTVPQRYLEFYDEVCKGKCLLMTYDGPVRVVPVDLESYIGIEAQLPSKVEAL